MMNRKNVLNAWDRVMAAITFAEAGEVDTAREIMKPSEKIHQEAEVKIEIRQEKPFTATLRI